MVSFERAGALLDEIAEGLPEGFYKYLNGGICLLPGTKVSQYGDQLLVMGEYVYNRAMGRYINIYYGSMRIAHGHLDDEGIKEQLREVLLHEFTHHIESLSGERGLEIKDAEQIRKYLEK